MIAYAIVRQGKTVDSNKYKGGVSTRTTDYSMVLIALFSRPCPRVASSQECRR